MAKIYQFNQVNSMVNQSAIANVTISDVAKAFLNMESMSPKKLQKLCYYAYAWYMVITEGDKLFDGGFEAWIHGPVNPELYQEYKEYGWNSIPKVNKIPRNISDDPELAEILEVVYSSYGHLDANQLEFLTHQEEPWLNARAGLKPYESSNELISDGDIFRYYRGELEDA